MWNTWIIKNWMNTFCINLAESSYCINSHGLRLTVNQKYDPWTKIGENFNWIIYAVNMVIFFECIYLCGGLQRPYDYLKALTFVNELR